MRLIDADALIEFCAERWIPLNIDAVNMQPTIQPERVEGEWIPHKSKFGGLREKVYTCDKCGYNIGFRRENYCPNCGAKMKGAEHETN